MGTGELKIVIILGTRPEIIKMSPIIRECEVRKIDTLILHTGQHYDFMLDKVFFEELGLNLELVNLKVGSGTHAEMTGKMMIGIEKVLIKEKPDIVLVQGDTNTALSGALVSVKLHIPLAHVEAGLRSYDRRMPEEYNRIICDHIADYLFTPTKLTQENLEKEGISKEDILYYGRISTQKIFLTGNTIVDVVKQNLAKIEDSKILSELSLEKRKYFLLTAHRQENISDRNKLLGIISGLKGIVKEFNVSIIYPIHPRAKKALEEFDLMKEIKKVKGINIINPLNFFDILALEFNAACILTDSGGIQEEACIMQVPCVVLRDRSDRPESLEVGASMLVGSDSEKIVKGVKEMMNRERDWSNPFGDGRTGERIISLLQKI